MKLRSNKEKSRTSKQDYWSKERMSERGSGGKGARIHLGRKESPPPHPTPPNLHEDIMLQDKRKDELNEISVMR